MKRLGKCVLGSKEMKQFSEVVNETGDLHPVWLAIPANRLCSLEEMLNLREVRLYTVEMSAGTE